MKSLLNRDTLDRPLSREETERVIALRAANSNLSIREAIKAIKRERVA